jgi:hypothetical protein
VIRDQEVGIVSFADHVRALMIDQAGIRLVEIATEIADPGRQLIESANIQDHDHLLAMIAGDIIALDLILEIAGTKAGETQGLDLALKKGEMIVTLELCLSS